MELRPRVVAYVNTWLVLRAVLAVGRVTVTDPVELLTPVVVNGSSRATLGWNSPLPPASWLATASTFLVVDMLIEIIVLGMDAGFQKVQKLIIRCISTAFSRCGFERNASSKVSCAPA